MIKSMTGFGRGVATVDGREISVELKSVNHKYLDLNFRMPRSINFVEETLRKQISSVVSRGHLDIMIQYSNKRSDLRQIYVDTALAGQYVDAARSIADTYAIPFDITATMLLRFPDVITVTESDENQGAVMALVSDAMDEALSELCSMREREGARLRDDFLEKIRTLWCIHEQITKRAPVVVDQYREKLSEKVAALLQDIKIDPDRLTTEIMLFAEKTCIDEELVRIRCHIQEIEKLISENEPVGRRMDFLIQELNREFNTIGSKANDSELAKYVVLGKSELEKLREQVQNIE